MNSILLNYNPCFLKNKILDCTKKLFKLFHIYLAITVIGIIECNDSVENNLNIIMLYHMFKNQAKLDSQVISFISYLFSTDSFKAYWEQQYFCK